jgi:GT2 family glycosyltransferase
MTRTISAVHPSGRLPYASEVMAAADRSTHGVVVFGSHGPSDVPGELVLDLLVSPFRVGAVVPWPEPEGAPAGARRDVTVTTSPLIALRASLVAGAGIDPREDDPDLVVGAALASLRARGYRVVAEPAWTLESRCPAHKTLPKVELGEVDGRSRVLIITDDVSDQRHDDRSTRDLITSLNAMIRHGQLTILLTERPASMDLVDAWRSEGIEVEMGPPDPRAARGSDWGHYSHAILTSTGARSRARRWIEAAQPQAARVVFFPSLSYRQVDALSAITEPDELPALEMVRSSVEQFTAAQARWADAVWCEDGTDVDYLSGLLPATPVVRIPPRIRAPLGPARLEDRRGVVIVATEGHDVIAATEAAATRCLEQLLVSLRWRDPQLECTVVSDWPSPMLESAVATANAKLVRSDHLSRVIESARLLLAAHHFGTGQRTAIVESLQAGTPFVATPPSVGGLDLGDLASISVCATPFDLTARSRQLLSSDAWWERTAELGRRLLTSSYTSDQRASALRAALESLGIDVGPPVRRWPGTAVEFPLRRPHKPMAAELRPPGCPQPPALDGPGPRSEQDRYELWAERFGPNAAVLDAIRADLRHLHERPRISVLMPVYNTDPQVLEDAVSSVRTQIYDNWELCIANDGSDRPETLAVLDALRREAGIKVVDLGGQSGISEATNAALALADGDFVALLDHDDVLKPHALAQVARWIDADGQLDVIYSDEDKIDTDGRLRDPHLKPDWSPDQLLSQNYMCHLTVARRSLIEAIGGFRAAFDGSQDYDLVLRLTERTERIGHIPEPLYSWRAVPGSFAADEGSKPYAVPAGQRAIRDALQRRGVDGEVDTIASSGRYRVRYSLPSHPSVSIVIPTKDGLDLLRRCIDSVVTRSTYDNYEIVIVDNQSTDADTLAYLADGPWRVIPYPHRFHYARMINLAARLVECDALLFLNNDTEVITSDWIEALLEQAMRPEVGVVGGRLFWADGRPQHEGIMVGTWGDWAHNIDHGGYFHRGEIIRNTSAVTGACTMIRPSVYWRVGGKDERLRVAYNDVDLCLRVRQAGYRVVYTPYAELYHHEGSSRQGYQHPNDARVFDLRWNPKGLPDPYYSPVLSNDRPFEIKV